MGFARGGIIGGRGLWAQRRRVGGVVLSKIDAAISAGGGGAAAERNVTARGGELPDIANFSQKNIVSFDFEMAKASTLTIKDDKGKIFEGKFEGAGASRVTYSFKEGFVIKFDGLQGSNYQNKGEVDAYKTLKPYLKKRVPKLLASYSDVKIKTNANNPYTADIVLLTKAAGSHDTGIKDNTPKGRQLYKRLTQYVRILRDRGQRDFAIFQNNQGNIYLHNIYRNPKNGKLTIVDLGI